MIPLALRLTNFGSVKATQTFHFPQEPGLYFMQGVNQVEPRLGSNGAGKTTVWKALTWLLYSKTGNGLKAGDVCNWDTNKGVEVALDFRYEDDDRCTWTMTRTWKPNTWRLSHAADYVTDEEVVDLTKDESNPVLAAIRLGFEPFLNTVLMAQDEPMFLDLKHDQKAALFSDVLGLDLWLDYSAKASKRATAQDIVTRGLERTMSGLVASREQNQGIDLRSHTEKWERERAEEVSGLEERYQKVLKQYHGDKEDLRKAEAQEPNYREVYQQVVQRLEAITESTRKLKTEHEEARVALGVAEEKVRAAQNGAKQGRCPTCGQKIDAKHAENHESLVYLKAEARNYAELEADLRGDVNRAADELEEWLRKEKWAAGELEDAQRAVSQARRNVLASEKELDGIEDRVEKLEADKNPYDHLEAELKREALRIANDIARTQRLLDDSMSQYSLFSFWVRGFKEVRLQLIAEALNELEVEVNSCVAQLGLVDWELNFMVDRETKGGNIQKGFNVFVRSPHNEEAVPWEAWSGGEKQRLRIAGQMGLANLIRTRCGSPLNLEVWDEPSQGLSPEGVTDLLNALAARAQAEERQIWIVDHTAHSFGGFAGGAVITKTREGSKLTELDASGIYLK